MHRSSVGGGGTQHTCVRKGAAHLQSAIKVAPVDVMIRYEPSPAAVPSWRYQSWQLGIPGGPGGGGGEGGAGGCGGGL